MPDTNAKVIAAAKNLIGNLERLNAIKFGLTDAVIAGITATGTVAKLKTAIAALNPRTQDKMYRDEIAYEIDRCNLLGIITDANVETARAAGTFAALRTAILANSTLITNNVATNGCGGFMWAQ